MRPRIFIGSSTESHRIAIALQAALRRGAEVTVWSQDVFRVSRSHLDNLRAALYQTDFGVFVFAPDDMIRIRGTELATARDNVIYELGLFSGWLGYNRCFVVRPFGLSRFRLPTDLLGLSCPEYEPTRDDRNWAAAVGPAADAILSVTEELGRFSSDDTHFDIDPAMRTYPPLIPNTELAGLWLSWFTFRSSDATDGPDGVQYDIEHLVAHGVRVLHGRNVLALTATGRAYYHELRIAVIRGHVLGRWFNSNSQNFGSFQLKVASRRSRMVGRHIGHAADNSVQVGDWTWVKLDLDGRPVSEIVRRIERMQLRSPTALAAQTSVWSSADNPIPLTDVVEKL
jgi:hypothetical protein